jgi:hypothetical protein
VPKPSLNPGENSPILITERVGERRFWRARCSFGTVTGEALRIEANSRVSAEDARAKIEAKLEKAREGSAAPAVVASDSTLVTQRAATPPIISSASRAIRGPLLADCEVTLVSWTPDEAGFPLRGCPCGTEDDTQDVHGALPG